MSGNQQPTDAELLRALDEATNNVERGRALFAAKDALQRRPVRGSAASKGRDQHAARAARRQAGRR